MKLHVDIHDGTGPYLLMVHGFLSSREQWRLNVEALSAVCCPVVVELWGHGRSPTPDDAASYRADTYVAQFEALRRRLGCETWAICGQSLGAALTLRYCLDHPERTLAHVFTNSASALAGAAWTNQMRAGVELQASAIEAASPDEREEFPVHPARAKRLPPHVRDALVRDARLHDARGLAHTLRFTTPGSSSRDRVRENRVPTLLVCGDRETRFAANREYAEAVFPKLRVVRAEGGHAVNIEAAEAFNEAAIEFLATHAPPRPGHTSPC